MMWILSWGERGLEWAIFWERTFLLTWKVSKIKWEQKWVLLTASNSPIYRICKHRSMQFQQHLSLGSMFEKSVLSLPALFWACLMDGSWSSWKSLLHSRFQSVLRQVSLSMRRLFSFNRPSWEKRKRFLVESLPTYRLYLASRTSVIIKIKH